jgi:hypothetical protein
MSERSSPVQWPSVAWSRAVRGAGGTVTAGAVLLAALVAACAPTQGHAPAAAARGAELPADPVLAFAATSAPGSATRVTLPDTGQSVQLRLVRSYNAASGRECREIQEGAGATTRARLICSDGTRWTDARPLLRGGAIARP